MKLRIEVYDPRQGIANLGELPGMVGGHVREGKGLLLISGSKAVVVDWHFHAAMFSLIHSDCLCMHVYSLSREPKLRSEIERRAGSPSLVPEHYFGLFHRDHDTGARLIQLIEELGTYEYWSIAGFGESSMTPVKQMNLQRGIEETAFFAYVELFDFISWFDLDCGSWTMLANVPELWDEILKFIKEYEFKK